MCGITGYFDYKEGLLRLDRKYLDHMTDCLSHRGPDGRGVYQSSGIGLGHRRLSIIDLSDRGHQPMGTSDGEVWLTYNGEVYNFRQLRKELEKSGHRFFGHSDTEVVLHAYLEWGTDCVHKLNGIFAFAVWDGRHSRLWLARDPLGVKPLFYSDYNGKIIFASEIPSFFHYPDFPKDPDFFGLDAFFSFGYVPAPWTGYKHIKQLLPGQWLLAENKSCKFNKYWDVDLTASKLSGDHRELGEEFNSLLLKAVERQMVSDVPLGAFLSSGTDSFAIVRAMQRINQGQTRAFSIGFKQKSFNELPDAILAAKALNVNLTYQYMDINYNDLFQKVVDHSFEPFADSSSLPVYLLCEMTSRHVKVALSGDGADELLAGYETYNANEYAEIYRKIPQWIRRGILNPAACLIPPTGSRYSLHEKATRFVYGVEQGKWRDHASWRIIFSQRDKQKLYSSDFLREIRDSDPIDLYVQPMKYAKKLGCSDLDCYLYADLTFYLPNDMLVKVDRMSMAHGLEVRVPFLDKDLVEFVWRLPVWMKYSRKVNKPLLRSIIQDTYPKRLSKIGKRGFNIPAIQWNDNEGKITHESRRKDLLKRSKLKNMDRYQHYAIKVFTR